MSASPRAGRTLRRGGGAPGPARDARELPESALRWCCDAGWLPFDTTESVEPITGVVGQDDAIEALRYGLEVFAPGQNIFVRGIAGTGRMTLVRKLMEEISPACPLADDRCYVHNFAQPARPRLITLPRGRGAAFARRVDRLIEFIEQDLGPALAGDAVRAARNALDARAQEEVNALGKPFEDELKANGLVLVPHRTGETVQPEILPLVEGKAVAVEELEKLGAEGAIPAEEVARIRERIAEFAARFDELSRKMAEVQIAHRDAVRAHYEAETRRLLGVHIAAIEREFDVLEVRRFLADVVGDLVQRLGALEQIKAVTRLYRVNAILVHDAAAGCPMIIETAPSLRNLLGEVEHELVPEGGFRADHLMIQAGSLLHADGGYLVLEARDVLAEPGAWMVLMRTLRAGKLEIVPADLPAPWAGPVIKPDPITIAVKVVLVGDAGIYEALNAGDPDFNQLFKVLADFETMIARNETGVRYYAGVIARIARDEGLARFSREAVATLAEHGARIAGRRDRLTTRFGRLADIVREAAFLTAGAGRDTVTAEDVREAVRRGRRRADLPARRFREMIAEGTIGVQTRGEVVGQVNGLAVVQAGPLTYGFPQRITATIGPGTAGAVDIEREAELSGAIHTKGFYILGGLLRHLLRTRHPLAFSASVAFEQSYGGIDGDSASAAEMCCLLSALTDVPLRQDLAMTGAIDQLGHVQAVGAVTEKVEGFYAACASVELTGSQGVVIPRANAGDLMLNPEVMEACVAGRFHIYAVETIHDALELLTGRPAGRREDGGAPYETGTLLRLAEERALEYWRMARERGDAAD